jgi:hypothetical protein
MDHGLVAISVTIFVDDNGLVAIGVRGTLFNHGFLADAIPVATPWTSTPTGPTPTPTSSADVGIA